MRLHRATSQILHELGVLALGAEKPARNRVSTPAPELDIVPVADGMPLSMSATCDLSFSLILYPLLFEYRIDVPSFGVLWGASSEILSPYQPSRRFRSFVSGVSPSIRSL